jgi:hypothetical protein
MMQAGLGIHCFARFAWDENYGCVRGGVLADKCYADITLALLFFQMIFGQSRRGREWRGGGGGRRIAPWLQVSCTGRSEVCATALQC